MPGKRSSRALFCLLSITAGLVAVSTTTSRAVQGGSQATTAPRGATVPFLTYEAEDQTNTTTGRVVTVPADLPLDPTVTPEREASGRAFVELTRVGDQLTIPVKRAADGLVLRHCIPDAPTGNGQTATLSLYVNGKFRQKLTLSSKYNWLYGKAGENGQSDDPTAGVPHVFWDENRFRVTGGLKQGDQLRLQKDTGDSATFYRLDLLELESIPTPLTPPKDRAYLSVTDFGANGTDTADDTVAIQSCITAAKAQNKGVWIPSGTYYQSGRFIADGITIRGAGMWHTTILGNIPETGFGGSLGFTLQGDGATVSDLSIESLVHTRRSFAGGKSFLAAFNNCRNWRVENVWMTHVHCGFWMSGAHSGLIRGCRVRCTYADGININRGSTKNVVENNHVRGIGDDGIALLSEQENTPTPSADNIVRSNTISAVWWGHNLDVAGGGGHIIENNLLADNPLFGCLTINLPGAFPMYPLTSATFRHNTVLRGGGNYVRQRRGALWIFAGSTTAQNVVFEENEFRDSAFRAIHLTGSKPQGISFLRNRIISPGQDAIVIDSSVQGTGIFTGNTIENLPRDTQPFINGAGAAFTITASGNSWQ